MEQSLQKYKDHFLLFVEAGFIATNQADEDAANKPFRACELLNPSNSLPRIGMGYLHLLKLELKAASKLFEEVLTKEPTNDMARTFLGLSLAMTPNETSKGEKYLEESAKKATDPIVKSLAENALKFVNDFVKKPPSPADLEPKRKKKKK